MRFSALPAAVAIACISACSETGDGSASITQGEPAEVMPVVEDPALTCPSGVDADSFAQLRMTGFIENRINRRGLKDHLMANQNDWGYRFVENEGRCMLNINGRTFYEGNRYTFSEYCDYELKDAPDGGQELYHIACAYR